MRILIIALLIFFYQTTSGQSRGEFNKFVKQAFSSFDSVASGSKNQASLKLEQTAFLYVITDWTKSKVPFEHYKGFQFTKGDVKEWKQWYRKHCDEIDVDDFLKAMNVHKRVFNGDPVPDSVFNYLDELRKKYSSLRH
jgi:hypothetical protein